MEAEKKFSWGDVLVIFCVVLATAAIVGGLVYYFTNRQAQSDKSAANSQIQSLQEQVDSLKSEQATAVDNSSWKTYTNASYGFSFKYPSDWTVAENAVSYGDARSYEISFASAGANTGYSAEVYNMNGQTANAFVNSYFSQIEAGPSSIQDVTINDNQVVKFVMLLGCGSGSGSTNFLFSSGSIGVALSNSASSSTSDTSTLQAMANTFEFN